MPFHHPHRLDVVCLGLTAVEAAVLGKLVEQLTEAGLIRAGFTPLLISVARGLGILDHDAVPSLRALNGHHARVVYLLIGPEGVADVVTLEHLHKIALPLHRVMAELSHVHRAADGVAEVDVVGDGLLGGRTSIAMTGVHQLVVVARIVEHPEEAVPMGTAEQDDVVLVHLADGLHTALVERLQELVERVAVGEVMGDGLVHQFVAEDGGLLPVALGYLLPDGAERPSDHRDSRAYRE